MFAFTAMFAPLNEQFANFCVITLLAFRQFADVFVTVKFEFTIIEVGAPIAAWPAALLYCEIQDIPAAYPSHTNAVAAVDNAVELYIAKSAAPVPNL